MTESKRTIPEIIEKLQSTSSLGLISFKEGFDKLNKEMAGYLQELVDIAVEYKKLIEASKSEWVAVKSEVDILKTNKEALKKREVEVEERIKKANEQEEGLVTLHKVLDNRRRVLDIREAEIKEKERRVV